MKDIVMFHKENFGKTIKYFDTSLVALILSMITIPPLWYISQGNSLWVLSCAILWGIGVFVIFHPSIRFLFPFLLTKMGAFALTFILAIGTIILNSIIISMIIPIEDMEIVMNSAFFSTSIGTIALFIWFYIIMAEATISNINLNLNSILKKQKRIISHLFTLPEYYLEVLLLFVSPVGILFWADITYSFRVLLALISIGVGISILISKVSMDSIQQRVLISTLSMGSIVAINSAVIYLFVFDRVPSTDTIQIKNISNQSFQLSKSEQNDEITIYQIVASIPQISLHLGHKVATIPNREITIEATKSQYTIHDQYNDKVLLTLDR
jgi:hypothetical protein